MFVVRCLRASCVQRARQDEIILLHNKHIGRNYALQRHWQLNERHRLRCHNTIRMAEAQEVIPAISLWGSFGRLFQKFEGLAVLGRSATDLNSVATKGQAAFTHKVFGPHAISSDGQGQF
jgi:hypothetical protein